MPDLTPAAAKLSPLCYVRHPTTGETVEIRRGEAAYHPVGTLCSPDCLNSRLARPPTEDEISAMRHGSLIGWDRPGADPEMWRHRREARS